MSTRKPQSGPNFVRSWDTETPASRSSQQLEEILRRYGAHGFTVSTDYKGGTVLIGFTMPRTLEINTTETAEIRIGVSFGQTLRRLDNVPQFVAKKERKPYGNQKQWAIEQAERVAWRQLILWVEASLNAVAAGVQTLDEAFFAHQMVEIGGQKHRAIDVVTQAKRLGSGSR